MLDEYELTHFEEYFLLLVYCVWPLFEDDQLLGLLITQILTFFMRE